MKKKIRGLSLSKETLRRLGTQDLGGIAGGVSLDTSPEGTVDTCEGFCQVWPTGSCPRVCTGE